VDALKSNEASAKISTGADGGEFALDDGQEAGVWVLLAQGGEKGVQVAHHELGEHRVGGVSGAVGPSSGVGVAGRHAGGGGKVCHGPVDGR
jgi:hypothetical protein